MNLAAAVLLVAAAAVLATASPASAAGEPTNLTVTSGDGSLVVSWTAPADVTPVAYTVRHRQKGTSTWTTSSAINHPTLSYTLSTLTNGTVYEVQVRTSNPGPSSWVNAEGAAGAPGNPSGLTLVSGNRQLGVSWTAPANNGSAVTDYDIRYRDLTSTGGWTEYYDGGETTAQNTSADTSSGPGGDPVDFGDISGLGLTVTREAIGDNYGVYKLGSAVDKIRFTVRLSFAQEATMQARYASTKPTAGNLATHGTELWSQSAIKITETWWRATRSGNAPPLAADSYIWITTSDAETVTSSLLNMRVDLASTATSAIISGLANGNEHDVQVRASNARGEGSWSASARLKTGLPDAPGSPTVVPGNSQLAVSWTAPAGNGQTIRDYDVQYSSDSGATWQEFDSSATSTDTTATVTGLTNGTTYLVQVRAGNLNGDGAWSLSTTATAGVPVAPSAPALTSGNLSLEASWAAPATNGSDITDYDVQYRAAGSSTWTDWKASETNTTATTTITGLTNGTSYEVRLRAVNARGDGLWSPSASASPAAQKPAAPAAPTLASGNASLEVNWVAPAANGSSITDYDVQYSSDSGATWEEFDSSTTSTDTSATVTGLINGTSYQVQVRAVNSVGDGPWSPSATLKAGLPAAPAAPDLLPGDGSLRADWSAPSGNGSTISGYDVQYSSDSGATWLSHTHTGTGASATIPTLTNGTSHQVQVRAKSSVGTGPWSPSAAVIVGTPAPPIAPTLTVGNAQLAVAWAAPTTNGAAITDYDVRYRADGTNAWTEWDASATSTTTAAAITGLTNGTTYHMAVRAANSRGDGPWSASTSAAPARAGARRPGQADDLWRLHVLARAGQQRRGHHRLRHPILLRQRRHLD